MKNLFRILVVSMLAVFVSGSAALAASNSLDSGWNGGNKRSEQKGNKVAFYIQINGEQLDSAGSISAHDKSFYTEALYTSTLKAGLQLRLNLLGPGPHLLQRTAALGAALGNRLGKAAIVAHQPVIGAVVGEVHAAPGAFRHLAAAHTLEHPAGAPAVQEEDGLLSPGHGLLHSLKQGTADHGVVACPDLLLHVHQPDLGKGHAVEPACQAAKGVHPRSGPVHGLHGRRGGTQKHQRLLPVPPKDGHLPGAIPWGVL